MTDLPRGSSSPGSAEPRRSNSKPGKDDLLWSIWLAAAILVIVGGVAVGLSKLGVNGSTSVAALISGAISYVGLVFKRQNDDRLERDAARSQGRLDVESAMRAVQLLTLTDGKPADQITTDGALLSLMSLGQSHLATTLLYDLWPAGRVTATSVVLIIDDALKSGDETTQVSAASVLFWNSNTLWDWYVPKVDKTKRTKKQKKRKRKHDDDGADGDESYSWPNSIAMRWLPSLPFDAKVYIVQAWAELWLTAGERTSSWSMQSLVVGLYSIWNDEPDEAIKNSVGKLLRGVIGTPGYSPVDAWVYGQHVQVSTAVIPEIDAWSEEQPRPLVTDITDYGDRLKEWSQSFVKRHPAGVDIFDKGQRAQVEQLVQAVASAHQRATT